MSAAKTGTPWLENPSARICKVTVLPVPVAPVIRPCRFASLRFNSSRLTLLPMKTVSSELIIGLPGPSLMVICVRTTLNSESARNLPRNRSSWQIHPL